MNVTRCALYGVIMVWLKDNRVKALGEQEEKTFKLKQIIMRFKNIHIVEFGVQLNVTAVGKRSILNLAEICFISAVSGNVDARHTAANTIQTSEKRDTERERAVYSFRIVHECVVTVLFCGLFSCIHFQLGYMDTSSLDYRIPYII